MAVWFICPSKRPRETSTLKAWQERGYMVAVLREPADGEADAEAVIAVGNYIGWAASINSLARFVFRNDSTCDWVVAGGDDYLPDPDRTPEDIARECSAHFQQAGWVTQADYALRTFGVMQPTGDRWGEGPCTTCGGRGITYSRERYGVVNGFKDCADCNGSGRSAIIDRICGSPWLGREFCRRVNGGTGPLHEGYFHNFADQELQEVARSLGVLWQRRDLVQTHQHWARPRGDWADAPSWAKAINDPIQSDWDQSKALFAERKAAGFPGHEVLA
jgi:hypothetical protein